ncbi:MAG: MFS transporter [Candidatus Hodarchaeales archaeon]
MTEKPVETEELLAPIDEKPKSVLKLLILIVSIGSVFAGLNISMFFDQLILPKYLVELLTEEGKSTDEIQNMAGTVYNLLRSVQTLFYLSTIVVTGAISDNLRSERFGNRVPMVLIGVFIVGFCYSMGGILIPMFGNPLIPLFLVYIGKSIGFGFVFSPGQALVSELFTKEERGWVAIGLAFTGGFGSISGIVLQAVFGQNYAIIMIIAGVMAIVFGIIMFTLTPKHNPSYPPTEGGAIRDILNTPKYILFIGTASSQKTDSETRSTMKNSFLFFFLVQMCWGAATYIISANFALFIGVLNDDPRYNLGLSATVGMIILMGFAAIFAVPAGILINIIGKTKAGMVGSLLLGIATFIISQEFAWNIFGVFLVIAIAGGGFIIIGSVSVALPADLVPKGKEGQFMGLFILARDFPTPLVAFLIAMIFNVGGETATLSNYSTLFLITTVVEFVAVFLLAFVHYEDVLESEYRQYYQRYLLFRGSIRKNVGKVRSTVKTASRRVRKKR